LLEEKADLLEELRELRTIEGRRKCWETARENVAIVVIAGNKMINTLYYLE